MAQPSISPSEVLEITLDRQGKEAVIHVSGRIDVDTSPDLRDRLRSVFLDKSPPQAVTVDLAAVPYIETSGVATLIEALRTARHHQIDFRLQGLGGAVLRLLEVTGVKAMFESGGQEQSGQEQKVN